MEKRRTEPLVKTYQSTGILLVCFLRVYIKNTPPGWALSAALPDLGICPRSWDIDLDIGEASDISLRFLATVGR